MATSKKSIATKASAIALAAALFIGMGTYSYLYDSAGVVTNTFDTNEIDVELDETTGKDYDIIPGTSQKKDPTVTVTTSVAAYVFIEVDDQTEGLVEWAIAEGWAVLDETNYPNVYYRVVTVDEVGTEQTFTFAVLEGDKVSYSSDITNDDMAAAGSNVTLSFTAKAIQKDSFDSAIAAYNTQEVSTSATLISTLASGGAAILTANIEVSAAELDNVVDESTIIDLNGNTLTISGTSTGYTSSLNLDSGESMTISNGTLVIENEYSNVLNRVSISVSSDSELTLSNVNMTTDASIFIPSSTDNATINIINSTITSSNYYAVSTNASDSTSGQSVVINIDNSTLTATNSPDSNGDASAILFNIPGTLNITDSTITGSRHGVIVRCGTANISNSTITSTGTFLDSESGTSTNTTRLSGTWGSGNEVPAAALVVGNLTTGSYPYAATASLSNVTLTVSSYSDEIPAIYAASCEYNTIITGASDSDTVLSRNSGSATITINGTTVNTNETMVTVSGLSN